MISTQTRFTNHGNIITKIESIVTHREDWVFNATSTLMYAVQENDWGVIPTTKRDNRTTLQAVADSYLDDFMKGTAAVPSGPPCARLEGGIYIDGSCNVRLESHFCIAYVLLMRQLDRWTCFRWWMAIRICRIVMNIGLRVGRSDMCIRCRPILSREW